MWGFRLWEILGEDLWGFMRLWERICETLGEDSWLFARIHGDLQGFTRLWERIREDLLWRGFAGIHKDSQDFGRGLHRDS